MNAMKVAPAQQVMLKVRFLEVARSASREIGVNWFGANNGGNRGFTTGIGSASPGAGLPDPTGTRPLLTRAEIRYPRHGSPAGSGAPGLPIF